VTGSPAARRFCFCSLAHCTAIRSQSVPSLGLPLGRGRDEPKSHNVIYISIPKPAKGWTPAARINIPVPTGANQVLRSH